jgi:hypothetical protein
MSSAVINEIGARLEAEVLVVGEDDALVERLREILLDSIELVLQGRGIVPRDCGKDIAVVFLSQSIHRINGTRHRLHQLKDTGDVIVMRFPFTVVGILGFFFVGHLVESTLEGITSASSGER